MADEASKSVDFWSVLEEAKQTVESWPAWQQRYEADIYYEGYPGVSVKTTEATDDPEAKSK
jgi:hypothetical protein